MEFPAIRGYLFSDTARVEGEINPTDGWLGSFGYSLAMTIFPPLVVRADFVRATDYSEVEDTRIWWSLSFLY